MLTYIYFVKCPGCEDEHFDFFNDAKDFALGCLSKKPIITQTEVDRNDFGECTDSCDLGTVWSWEDMMETEDTPAKSIFTKDDLKRMANGQDPEFDNIDNSLGFDSVEDAVDFLVKDEEEAIAGYEKVEDAVEDFDVENKKEILDTLDHIKEEEEEHIEELKAVCERKPVPEGMTIEQLVEEMEENEDDVECKSCGELFDKSECVHDKDYGWLCSRCQRAVEDHGASVVVSEPPLDEELEWHTYKITYTTAVNPDKEQTTMFKTWKFDVEYAWRMSRENIPYSTIKRIELIEELQESFNPGEKVEFIYDTLRVTLQGPKRAADDWDETEESVRHSFYKTKEDVATDIWENFIEEIDVKDVEGGLEALEDDKAWNDFLSEHFDDLLDKYYDKLLKYYEDEARKEYEETHSLNESINPHDLVELEYPSLTVTLYGEKRAEDDWDEEEYTDSHVFLVPKVEVATAIWENWITEEDAEDVLGGLKTLEDDRVWELFLETHFDDLFEKYNKQILDYFKEDAEEDFRERSQEEYQMNKLSADIDHAYDEYRDRQLFGEGKASKPFLEEFDDAETHKAALTDCPECGTRSYDMKEQYCTNCGLNL